jgi:beta-phosphoglucomutase-like phosphatase (HAD superfamily)
MPGVRSPPSRSRVKALGLPERVRACLFDLDGVLTETAKVHAAAWKEMFDAFSEGQGQLNGEPFVAFDKVADYDSYVDGKPRADGTRSFLESRHIDLPEGAPR